MAAVPESKEVSGDLISTEAVLEQVISKTEATALSTLTFCSRKSLFQSDNLRPELGYRQSLGSRAVAMNLHSKQTEVIKI
ncbi:hypothetical protein H0E87_007568 [Populus deltoides]|uniref:Uncharacterized protein n=1 Tax=Populus deltoides TaxID=3696 RepID=A0A8T2ZBM1_POPDE|nr:hypothetical protein H0E87_007568 [Populus deltoides]